MSVRGFVSGCLALIVLQVLVSRGGSKNVGGLVGALGSGAKRILDPTVPAIRTVKKGAGSSSGGATPNPAPGPSPAPIPTSQPQQLGLAQLDRPTLTV